MWLVVVLQVSQMRSLYGKCRETLRKMQQKTRDCLQQKEDMRQHMEEALHDKQAVKAFPTEHTRVNGYRLMSLPLDAMKFNCK